jgi:serine/threonine protein kinase
MITNCKPSAFDPNRIKLDDHGLCVWVMFCRFANKTMLAEREADMKEMLREVKFLRMNRHPCIIDIHDGFITAQPRVLNIICSYCEAGDLAKVIASSRKTRTNIPETQIVKWSMQVRQTNIYAAKISNHDYG